MRLARSREPRHTSHNSAKYWWSSQDQHCAKYGAPCRAVRPDMVVSPNLLVAEK